MTEQNDGNQTDDSIPDGNLRAEGKRAAMVRPRVKPELMSPAGFWPQLRAAIESGADAVYFGLTRFSARSKVGFTLEELPDAIGLLHERGVKGFVTFNTLVFDHEINAARDALIAISESGADSIIVQDAGIAALASQLVPDLPIHGSTQMSITSAQGAELAASLGCSRVVLGRELSLADIRRVSEQTDVELEVFVHGALCVSYSGQCFSSEFRGGRSANRGQCAQACRLSYELEVDGRIQDTGAHRYLLSPGDLYALEQIPQLIECGVHCLKIEGRYKDERYVAVTTSAYRRAIDEAWENRSVIPEPQVRLDLEQVYSRGLGPWFMSGANHQQVVRGRAPRHRGVRIGEVLSTGPDYVTVLTGQKIAPGDGVVFDASPRRSPDEKEEGGRIYEVKPALDYPDDTVQLYFGYGEIDFSRIAEGDLLWRTEDPGLRNRYKHLTAASDPVHTRPVSFRVRAPIDQPLEIEAEIDNGTRARFVSDAPLVAAGKHPLDEARLQQQLSRLGGTPFQFGSVQLLTDDDVFVPTSVLNSARRQLVEGLTEQRRQRPRRRIVDETGTDNPVCENEAATRDAEHPENSNPDSNAIHLDLLVRNAEQLGAAIEARPESITLDYLELYGLRKSVQAIREAGITARVASPRILKPGEQNVIRFLVSLDCELLIRSGGLLHDLVHTTDVPPARLHGDFSLNVTNGLTAKLMLETGLSLITPGYDLNAQQIVEIARSAPARSLEVIAYSHLPVFHMEHCLFCRFLSEGTDNTNCGHPCEKHRVAIKDKEGNSHPVMADVGCRNTVFGAPAQCDPQWLDRWTGAGIRRFRVEFVHQTAEQVASISNAFQDFFAGRLNRVKLNARLIKDSPAGIARGSLHVPADFEASKSQVLVQLNSTTKADSKR